MSVATAGLVQDTPYLVIILACLCDPTALQGHVQDILTRTLGQEALKLRAGVHVQVLLHGAGLVPHKTIKTKKSKINRSHVALCLTLFTSIHYFCINSIVLTVHNICGNVSLYN